MPAIILLLHTTKILKTVAYSHAFHLQHLTSSERNCHNQTRCHSHSLHSTSRKFTCTCFSTQQPFYGPFSGTTRWAGARRELLTLWCKGRLTEADTPTIRLGATPSGLSSKQCQPPPSPMFLQARCPSCRPTNSVKAPKATSAFGLGRRR